jgi:hypothetical protein
VNAATIRERVAAAFTIGDAQQQQQVMVLGRIGASNSTGEPSS